MRNLVVMVLAVYLTGCASVTRGGSEIFKVETIPSAADVSVSDAKGIKECLSPCSVQVKRRGQVTVTVSKDGYQETSHTVASSIDGAGAAGMAGNVILGGIIGAAVDAGTGAMHSHGFTKEAFKVYLEPVEEKPESRAAD